MTMRQEVSIFPLTTRCKCCGAKFEVLDQNGRTVNDTKNNKILTFCKDCGVIVFENSERCKDCSNRRHEIYKKIYVGIYQRLDGTIKALLGEK